MSDARERRRARRTSRDYSSMRPLSPFHMASWLRFREARLERLCAAIDHLDAFHDRIERMLRIKAEYEREFGRELPTFEALS